MTTAARRSRSKRSRGQALVEFSIVLPLFLLILLILVDFGRVIFAQNAITQNAHAATRFASVDAPQDAVDIRAKAQQVSPGVDWGVNPVTGDPGPNDFYSADGKRVVIQIQIQVPLVTPIISNIVGPITLTTKSEDEVR